MRDHIKIAIRFLLKHRNYSLLNITGLSFSLVAVILIALFSLDEMSFDRFHRQQNRIYRVIENKTSAAGSSESMADVPFKIADIPEMIPAVNLATHLTAFGRTNVLNDENTNAFYEDLVFADNQFLRVFDFTLLTGNRMTALKNPFTVLVTRETAEKIFGTTDIIGKNIRIDRIPEPFTISGVLENFPSNSHLKFNLLFSMESNASRDWYKNFQAGDWSSNFFLTYILLEPNALPRDIENEINRIVRKNKPETEGHTELWLQPLKNIHFDSEIIRGGYNFNAGKISYLFIFSSVGLIILIIACINYINLSTACSILRGKEVGIKKVTGAGRTALAIQFLMESVILIIVSMITAMVMVIFLLPLFNSFTGKAIPYGIFMNGYSLSLVILFTATLGFLSGGYPAFYLSGLKPVLAIKNEIRATRGSGRFRKGLVIFQFSLSMILIIATITAFRQINYIHNKNLGFNKEQLVVLDINSSGVRKSYELIKDEISKIPEVQGVSVSSRVPGEWKDIPKVTLKPMGDPNQYNAYMFGADADFLKTFEITLISGRNFSPGDAADSSAVLINQTAASLLGITEAGSQEVLIPSVNFGVSDEALDKPFHVRVIGIVTDFHYQPLYQKIAPVIIVHHDNPIQSIDYFTVRLSAGNWENTIKKLGDAIHQGDPGQIIEYNFLDQKLGEFYSLDVKREQLFTLAAFVSVFLTCLGLYSLTYLNTLQRTREIGIRKVLGASVGRIFVLICGEYLMLVLGGLIIAAPLSYWILESWLNSFAYRIHLNVSMILSAGLISILTALLTVGYRSLNAASANPVEALRSE